MSGDCGIVSVLPVITPSHQRMRKCTNGFAPGSRSLANVPKVKSSWLLAGMAFIGLMAGENTFAQPEAVKEWKPSELGAMDIEQLMQIRVTSVSRKEEPVANVAAAVYVLTPDEILRSGFNTIPEALRLVPGLEVARLDAHDWAISSRGFNDVFANKLLV